MRQINAKVKIFLSQPMSGLTNEEILEERETETRLIRRKFPNAEFISSFSVSPIENVPENADRLWYLGRAIQMMADADMIVFLPGSDYADGCRVESQVANIYNILILRKDQYLENDRETDEWYDRQGRLSRKLIHKNDDPVCCEEKAVPCNRRYY